MAKEKEKMELEEVVTTTNLIVETIVEMRGKGTPSFAALNAAVSRAARAGKILDEEFSKWRDAALDKLIQNSLEKAKEAAIPKEPGIVSMVGVRRSAPAAEIRDGNIVRTGVYVEKIRPGSFGTKQELDRHERQLPRKDRPDAD